MIHMVKIYNICIYNPCMHIHICVYIYICIVYRYRKLEPPSCRWSSRAVNQLINSRWNCTPRLHSSSLSYIHYSVQTVGLAQCSQQPPKKTFLEVAGRQRRSNHGLNLNIPAVRQKAFQKARGMLP